MTRFSSYDEELKINVLDDNHVSGLGDKLKRYIPAIEDKDKNNFVILRGKLLYIGDNELEEKAAERLGLNGGFKNSEETKKEIKALVNSAVNLKDKYTIPTSDSEEGEGGNDSSKSLLGIRLYKRNSVNLNNGKWNIVIDYDKDNSEIDRWDSGWYYLKEGETYIIDGTSIKFVNSYVINYEEEILEIISDRSVNWNKDSTLGVKENLALNLDSMNLENGKWEKSTEKDTANEEYFYNFLADDGSGFKENGLQKVGDVTYSKENKALELNENKEINPEGNGGYLKLNKNGLNFEHGFTFEMYCKLSRMRYNRGSKNADPSLAYFCRVPELKDYVAVQTSLRFCWSNSGMLCKFVPNALWEGKGLRLETIARKGIVSEDCGYSEGEEVYLTYDYIDYEDGKEDENYDQFMIDNKLDKLVYFVNGELYGYSYNSAESYDEGLSVWNNDECPFYIGVCPLGGTSDTMLYYLKGQVFSTRLYTSDLKVSEVQDNYQRSVKYRNSFKNEVIE